jgi:hypothetical protein
MRELIQHVADICMKFPQLADQAHDLLDLCQMEIEEGGSPSHEVELCHASLIELIENK